MKCFQATGMDEAKIQAAMSGTVEAEWRIDGDQVTHVTRASFCGNKEQVVTFSIGKEFTENTFAGQTLKVKVVKLWG